MKPDGPEPAEPAPRFRYVHYRRPRCPTCGSCRLRSYHTVRNGDDSLTRYSRCLDCGQRLFVVAE